jgi:hypothetical protein
MKLSRHSFLARALLGTAAFLPLSRGQTVEQVIVGQGQVFNQTSTADPVLSSPPSYFTASVRGTDLAGITAPVLTLYNPGSNTNYSFSNPSGHNGGTLGYAGDGRWNYGAPGFDDSIFFPSGAQRNTAFPMGPITMLVQGTTINLNTSGSGFPGLTVPKVTLSGGNWSGGVYVIDVSQPLTITTNAFASFSSGGTSGSGSWVESRIDSELADSLGNLVASAAYFHSENATNFITLTVPANTLIAGSTYNGFMENIGIVSMSTELSGALSAAYVGLETNYTVSAVPEPSTYAALAGAGMLAFASWRRRQGAKAILNH